MYLELNLLSNCCFLGWVPIILFPASLPLEDTLRQAVYCLRLQLDSADHRSILVVAHRKTMAFVKRVTTHVQR